MTKRVKIIMTYLFGKYNNYAYLCSRFGHKKGGGFVPPLLPASCEWLPKNISETFYWFNNSRVPFLCRRRVSFPIAEADSNRARLL
jgi:hypothetical protein